MKSSTVLFYLLPLALGVALCSGMSSRALASAVFGGTPLYFETNLGQADPEVQFVARNGQGTFCLTAGGVTINLPAHQPQGKAKAVSQTPDRRFPRSFRGEEPSSTTLQFTFERANPRARMSGIGQLRGEVNYLTGNNAAHWHKKVPTFNRIEVKQLYPGINLVHYGNMRQWEYDFVIEPGADPQAIAVRIEGSDAIELTAEGDLLITAGDRNLRQKRPVIYQVVENTKKEIEGGYRIRDGNVVSFEVGAYDVRLPLIIDPVLSYSTLIGALGNDAAYSVALDNSGNVFVAGRTLSPQLGTANSYQPGYNGGYPGAGGDAFVAKYDPTGTNLVFLTYLGGSGDESASGLAVDSAGNVYVTGVTDSTNFPIPSLTVSNRISGTGERYFGLHPYDAFAAKISSDGSQLIYATYLGGNGLDEGLGISVDAEFSAYVTGFTESKNFPTTANAFQKTLQGRADAFVTKIASNGTSFVYSTYLGGTNTDHAQSIAVDGLGRAFVTGSTISTNFPLSTNAFQLAGPTNQAVSQAFVSVLSADGSTVEASTLVGGVGSANGFHIALDSAGNPYVTGSETGTGFPITPGAINPGGIFKSTDAAADWNPSNNGLVHNQIDAIAIDPSNTANLYVGTGRGLALSTDAGASWQASLDTFDEVVSLAINPAQPSIIYAGSTEILKSTNSGASWFLSSAGLSKSITQSSNLLFSINKLLIDPVAPDTVYAATVSGVFKTTTGGELWRNSSGGMGSINVNDLALDPSNHEVLYAATSAGIFQSTNGAARWKTFNQGLTNVTANAVAVDTNNPAIVYAGMANGAIYRRSPSETNWVLVNSGLLSTNSFFSNVVSAQSITLLAVDPVVPSTIYAGTRDGLFKSLDAGTNWAVVTNGLPRVPIAALAIDPKSTSTLYVGTFNNFAGTDAFLTKFNADLSAIVYSVTLGGSGADQGLALAIDGAGNAYVAGSTTSADFPTRDPIGYPNSFISGSSDAFVTAIHSDGSDIIYSTYLGGFGTDVAYGIALDAAGNAWVAGQTFSSDFPVSNPSDSLQGTSDAFLARIGAPSSFVDVTLQTTPPGIALYVDGATNSTPVTFHWPVGSFHSLAAVAQSVETNVQYAWVSWSDGGNLFHNVRALENTNLTANFILQYFLTMASTNISVTDTNLILNSTNSGALSPLSGWYDAGTNLTISVIAPAADTFEGWVGSGSGAFTGPDTTANITMNGPIVETAIFSGPLTNLLKVVVVGNGTVSPNLDGRKLKVGTVYSMTAKPGRGYVFSAWSGTGFRIESPRISFQMTNGLVLKAEFVPTPFIPVSGSYAGLFFDTNVLAFSSSGFFSGTITTQGMLSAKLLLNGRSLPFSGQFTTDGSLSAAVIRPGLSSLAVNLQIDVANAGNSLTGLVSSGSWSAGLVANRAVFSKTNPPPQAGKRYTLIIPGAPDSLTEPGGDGYGTVTVDNAGNISFGGKLSDGTAVSQKTFISQDGLWPFYASLYGVQGVIIGWLTFQDQPQSDLGGLVAWFKSPRPFTSLYSSGFAIESSAVGSLFTNGAPVIPLNDGKGEVVLENGGLTQTFTNFFVLDSANKVTSADKLSLSFTTSSGLFRGTAVDPATSKAISFSGAVLQKQNRGSGFFRFSNQTGRVILEPQF